MFSQIITASAIPVKNCLSSLFYDLPYLIMGILVCIFAQPPILAHASPKEMDNIQTATPKAGDTIAIIKTNEGTMKAVIFSSLVPNTAANFVELARLGKYTNVPFHRVIKDFMIQGGDFTNFNGTGGHAAKGHGTTISDEYSPQLSHIRGALSWAKTAKPNSIGSQFFIVHGKNGAHYLDHKPNGGPADGYSVFGQLYEGFDVLDKIASVKTSAGDKPVQPMSIESIVIEQLYSSH